MAERSETLGIKLKINLDGDFAKLIKTVEDSLKKLKVGTLQKDLNNLKTTVASMQASMAGLSGTSLKGFAAIQAHAQKLNISLSRTDYIQAAMNEKVAKTVNKINEWGKGLTNVTGKYTSLQRAADLAYKNEEASLRRIQRAQAALQRQREKGIEAQRVASIRAITEEEKAARRLLQLRTAAAVRTGTASPLTATAASKSTKIDFAFGDMAKRLAQFYALRTVMFTITNQFREATAASLDFHQTLRDTAAIAVASDSAMRSMAQAAIEISKASKFTAVEVAGAMKTLAQAGVEAADVPAVTKVVSMFATGTGATMSQAVDLTATAMNVWNITAQDSIRIANTWTAALNESKLEAGQLGTILNYLANTSEQVGYSLEDVAGIVATLSNQGMKASTIGTSMSTLLNTLMAPKPRMRSLLKEFKIDIDEINPRLNSFADIIARFEKADIPLERLLGSMEIRTGRTLAAALSAGSEAFRDMTHSMNSSSAAFVANEKAMEGARAKMNVLKQSFTAFIIGVGDSLLGVFASFLEILRDLVAGMDTSHGKVVLLGAGIAALIPVVVGLTQALRAMMISNPWLLGASLAAAGMFAMFSTDLLQTGSAARALSKDFEVLRKKWAETEGSFIRRDSALRRVNEELRATGQAIVDINTKHEGEIRLTENLRSSLRTFLGEHSNLLTALDGERIAYKDIRDELVRLNAEKKTKAYEQAVEFNTISAQRKSEAKLLEEVTAALETAKGKKFSGYEVSKLEDRKKYYESRLKTYDTELSGLRPVLDGNQHVIYREGPGVYSPRTQAETDEFLAERKRENDRDLYREGGLSAAAGVGAYENELENKTAETTMDMLEAQLEAIKNKLSAGKDLSDSDKDKLRREYYDISDELLATELKNARVKAKQGMYDSAGVGHYYDAYKDEFTIPTKELDPKAAGSYQTLVNSAVPERTMRDIALQEQLIRNKAAGRVLQSEGGRAKEDSDIFRWQDREKATKTSTDNLIKGLELSKEQVWTAEQVRSIEQEIELTRLNSLNSIKDMLAAGEEHYIQLSAKRKLSDAEQRSYDNLLERQKQITVELQNQSIVISNMQPASFWEALKEGSQGAVKSLGTVEDATKELGASMTTTLTDGLTNSITGMVDALAQGENAWKSFTSSMGGIFKELGDMIVKYYAKLLVLYAVQQLVGIFAGGKTGSTQATSMGVNMSDPVISSGALGFGAAMGATGGPVSLTRIGNNPTALMLASGGAIPANLGEPGKDSVPAMLMPGEFVIRKAAVDKYGLDTFFRLNALKYADGGPVGAGGASGGDGSGDDDGKDFILNIINVVDPRTIPKTTATEILNVIRMDAAQNGATTRTIQAKIRGDI